MFVTREQISASVLWGSGSEGHDVPPVTVSPGGPGETQPLAGLNPEASPRL